MKHDNVVELYDYTENEKEIVLLMEYCNDPNYFENKIEEVSVLISSLKIHYLQIIVLRHGLIHCLKFEI